MAENKTPKTTNKTALQYALEHLPDAPADVREKWTNMIAQLDKKNAAPKKLTAQQKTNEGVKDAIADFLAENGGEGFTCGDLTKQVPVLEGKTPQYVSALMRQLVDEKRAEKYTDKRRTRFRAPVCEEEVEEG